MNEWQKNEDYIYLCNKFSDKMDIFKHPVTMQKMTWYPAHAKKENINQYCLRFPTSDLCL